MVRHRLVKMAVALAAAPVVVTTALTAMIASEAAGRHPLSIGAPRTMAEAAGMGDATAVIRFLEAEGDPNAIMLVRAGVLREQPVLASPLEAAILARDASLVRLLASRGARVEAEAACLALDVNAPDVIAAATGRPRRSAPTADRSAPTADRSAPTADQACEPGAAIARVLDRP